MLTLERKFVNVLLPITTQCNLQCIFCSQYEPKGTHVPLNEVLKLIDEALKYEIEAITLYGGEPMLHPNFFDIGSYIKRKKLKSGFITNGTLINEINLPKIAQSFDAAIISMHGFEKVHNFLTKSFSFPTTLRALELLNSLENFYLGVNITITKHNINSFDKFIIFLYKKFPNIKTFILNRVVYDGKNVSKEILLDSKDYKTFEEKIKVLKEFSIPIEIGIPSEELANKLKIQACSWNEHFKI